MNDDLQFQHYLAVAEVPFMIDIAQHIVDEGQDKILEVVTALLAKKGFEHCKILSVEPVPAFRQ